MCGLAGVIYKDKRKPEKSLLVRMANLVAHRGPDGEGYFIDEGIGLAFRRLAIIDLEKGDQPIFNEDKNIVVVYNGEIYNYKELRDTLIKKGHIFRTNSDTEIIVHAFEEWGEDSFLKFNGMFAFALYNIKTKELFLVRDRLGIKPLYFCEIPLGLVFGSEIKSMLVVPELDISPDYRCIYDFMTYQNILDEKTFFVGIKKLKPGCFIKFCRGKIKNVTYWDVSFNESNFNDINTCIEEYESVFNSSVKRHMISDVPVGTYLSGGFDSTSVATLASRHCNDRISTFTGAFEEHSIYDERAGARQVAERINARNYEILLKASDFENTFEEIAYYLDEPTLGNGAFPQYHVAKLACKHVKVVLTGHGGDELFAGYEVFKAGYYLEQLRNNPFLIFQILSHLVPSEILRIAYFAFMPIFYPEVKYGLFIMFDKKKRKRLFCDDFLNSTVKGYSPISTLETILKRIKEMSLSQKITYLYLKTYLPTLFIQEDKVSMAHSVEARIPICDNEMVEFALKLPMKFKIYSHTLKYITKTAMKEYLPQILYSLPKRGFPTPIASWFRKELKGYTYDVLLSDRFNKRGIFKKSYIKHLLLNHQIIKGKGLYQYASANRIYSLLLVEFWFRNFIDNKNKFKIE